MNVNKKTQGITRSRGEDQPMDKKGPARDSDPKGIRLTTRAEKPECGSKRAAHGRSFLSGKTEMAVSSNSAQLAFRPGHCFALR